MNAEMAEPTETEHSDPYQSGARLRYLPLNNLGGPVRAGAARDLFVRSRAFSETATRARPTLTLFPALLQRF